MSTADEPLEVPIRPYDGSLGAQIAALDLLSAKLALLPSRTRWPARIPLTSKASFVGEVVHTNVVKVHLGGEWWMEMTATEAADYITRRKRALLEYHARLVDGGAVDDAGSRRAASSTRKSSNIQFDPIFHPALSRGTRGAAIKEAGPEAETETGAAQATASLPISSSSLKAPVNAEKASEGSSTDSQATTAASSSVKAPVKPQKAQEETSAVPQPSAGLAETTTRPQTLEDLVERFMDQQRALQASSGKGKGREITTSDDSLVNEEGLPIHEIRENPDGSLIGSMPEGIQSGAEGEEISQARDDDYWSEETKKRRAALRRRIFHEGDDDSSEGEDDVDGGELDEEKDRDQNAGAQPPSISEPQVSAEPSQLERSTPSAVQEGGGRGEAVLTSSPQPGPTALPTKPSSLAVPAKSILKTPARKKSVSFDDSVPLPPDSPDGARTTMGFPLPTNTTTITDEFEPRPVPLLSAPRPPTKDTNGLAGFKRGFLAGGSAPKPVQDANAVPEAQPTKKPSLFAQRLASHAVKESAPPPSVKRDIEAPASPQASTSKPNLPKMSEHQMSYMKPAVVEKAAAPQGKTAIRPEDVKIVERNGPASVISQPEGLRGLSSRVGERTSVKTVEDQSKPGRSQAVDAEDGDLADDLDDGDDDDDDDDDDDSFYDDPDDDEDEDEYDLDDALLAREMALEYHRRHAYRSVSSIRDPDDPTMGMGDEDDEGDEVSGGPDGDPVAGSVMLALPQVDDSGQPMIVNPTPDDVKRFLRVGRLENGNLVLAAGERGWSDEDDDIDGGDASGKSPADADDKQVRRARREDIKRQLLGQPSLMESAGARQVYDESRKAAIAPSRQEEQERTDVPPRLVTEEEEPRSTAGIGEVREKGSAEATPKAEPSDAPKKVSRFKQARMG